MDTEPTVIDWIPNLLEGLQVTLLVAVLGAALMLALSVVLGIMARTEALWIRAIARAVIEFFRGTSLVIQLFWLYYVLPVLGVRIDAVVVGVLAFGLNFGAYGAEVVRGSLNAVPRAQWEAGTALNFTALQRMRKIIWPQAVVIMIPSMNNLLIQLLKSTPLLYTISLVDVMNMGRSYIFATGNTATMYLVLLVIYFILAYTITFFSKGSEILGKKRLGQHPGFRAMFQRNNDTGVLPDSITMGAGK